MRLVFDANVLVAALVVPGGNVDQAFARVIARADRLLISVPIIHEVVADEPDTRILQVVVVSGRSRREFGLQDQDRP